MINRFMRLIVLFDLPVTNDENKTAYRKFRDFLLDDGYVMIQFSVYVRLCRNQDDVDKHINRIKTNLPPIGDVRLLQVTESQYEKMEILRGKKGTNEQISVNSLTFFE